jgi:hypothetical protein
LTKAKAKENVSVVLVSLDFKRDIQRRVKPFIRNNKIRSRVVVLYEPDQNSWIERIDKTWSGSLPATLIVNNKKNIRAFYEKQFEAGELDSTMRTLLAK